MAKIKISTLRFRSATLKFILWFLGMAGFSFLISCAKYGAPVAEYGVPYPDNNINFHGKVLSSDSLKPIPGIDVKIYSEWEDTVRDNTNTTGDYTVNKPSYENQKVMLVFTDKDSTQHGKFFNKTVEVDVNFRDANNQEHQTDITLDRKP